MALARSGDDAQKMLREIEGFIAVVKAAQFEDRAALWPQTCGGSYAHGEAPDRVG